MVLKVRHPLMISFHGGCCRAGGGEYADWGRTAYLPHLMNISTQAVTRGDQATARGDPATVALVTLGCARNDVDSEELAARLEGGASGSWRRLTRRRRCQHLRLRRGGQEGLDRCPTGGG